MFGSVTSEKPIYGDIEAGYGEGNLYPGQTEDDIILRWGFIRKVYGILTVQVLLTMAVVLVVVNSVTVRDMVLGTGGFVLVIAILPLVLLCALAAYKRSHPTNLILLGLFTVTLSLTVGLACAFSPGDIVLEALVLTSLVVIGLTAYTYWASKRGQDFSFLGPMLFVALLVLLVWGMIQMFFDSGHAGRTVYALLGSIIFGLYIVYDTDNLIKRYDYDDYIWASVALYLDIINLFLNLLTLLREISGNGN